MRTFSGITPSNYSKRLTAQPAKVLNNKFGAQAPLPPTMLPLTFDWAGEYNASSANPNIGVGVYIPTSGPRQLLDKILSCRIDNTGNAVPVYVVFPDTGYTVVAPPNTVVWEPVETGGFSCIVYALGFTNVVGMTGVYLCNFFAPPVVDYEFAQSAPLWLASSTITRGNSIFNQNYGVPALGDQTTSATGTLGNGTTGVYANNLFGTPRASGFIYLTHMVAKYLGSASANGNQEIQINLESTGVAGTLYTFNAFSPIGGFQGAQDIATLSAMNVKLDATQLWRLRVISNATNGSTWLFLFNFTTNPN
jgi:hypothetical protein